MNALFLVNVVIQIINCTIENHHQAIDALNSSLTFEGHNIFRNNTGERGAAITLINSFMDLLPHTHILFKNNHANDVGGAIYSNILLSGGKIINCPKTAKITFTNNTAVFGGTSIYISGVHDGDNIPMDCDIMQNTDKDPSAIAGFPTGVHSCETQRNDIIFLVYPGQEFSLSLVVTSAVCNGAVPGIIHAHIPYSNAKLGSQSQSSQASGTTSCSPFNYSVRSTMARVEKSAIFHAYTRQKIRVLRAIMAA
jgi:predicted outer membrane repeat protein